MTKHEFESLAAFRLALRKFGKFTESSAELSGVTSQTYQALLAIKGFPDRQEITVRELAESLLLKHNSTVGMVDRLVSHGFVDRSVSPVDRRRVVLSLTVLGEKILEEIAVRNRRKLLELRPEFAGMLSALEELA